MFGPEHFLDFPPCSREHSPFPAPHAASAHPYWQRHISWWCWHLADRRGVAGRLPLSRVAATNRLCPIVALYTEDRSRISSVRCPLGGLIRTLLTRPDAHAPGRGKCDDPWGCYLQTDGNPAVNMSNPQGHTQWTPVSGWRVEGVGIQSLQHVVSYQTNRLPASRHTALHPPPLNPET